MKTNLNRSLCILFAALTFGAGVTLAAAPVGPNGGRIVTESAPHAEFVVDASHHAVVRFFDAELKPLEAAGRVVNATAETPAGRTQLEFAPRDGAMVSTVPLPEGDGYRVVLQIRDKAGARPRNYRIDLNLARCAECDRAEYACTCEGH